MKSTFKLIRNLVSAAALVAALSSGASSHGQEPMKPMKGGEHLLMLQGVDTTKQVDALKPGDDLAMVCAKCKTVWVTRVKQGAKGAQILNEHGQPTEVIGTHACPGCGSKVVVTGHTKGDTTELKHTCGKCGDDSAFCCATKPGSGPTKGMEKK
jgi:ribosomal protein S27AE